MLVDSKDKVVLVFVVIYAVGGSSLSPQQYLINGWWTTDHVVGIMYVWVHGLVLHLHNLI